jgi:ADP-ribose pyrophosphatase
MEDKVKIINQNVIYDGYLKLSKYDLNIPSLNLQKNCNKLNGREVVKTSDSVHVLLYSPQTDCIVFCEEFRPGVYFNDNNQSPFIFQCVAGTIEEGETPVEAARKEVKEETGIIANKLELIAKVYKSPGILTEKSYIFYSELKDIPKAGLHGTIDEDIKTHVIARDKVFRQMDELMIMDSATLLALTWFRLHCDKK